MQTENIFGKNLPSFHGNMGPPVSNIQGAPVVPKMGVRARVSDWPQRKEKSHEPPPRFDSLMTNVQYGIPSQSTEDLRQSQGSPHKTSLFETKYGLFGVPLDAGFHPLQKRSNSDITISDLGAEDVDQTAINPNTGASLHREYGSTSSIDRQNVGGKFLPVGPPEKPSAPPSLGLPEYLRYDAISPSLQTAAQIARGEIVCITSSDYVDGSLFYGRDQEKAFLQRQKSEKGETSIFRRLKTMKSESKHFPEQDDCSRHGCTLTFQRCFAHYDVQSVLFNIGEAVMSRSNLARRKNITTGASAASQHHSGAGDAVESGPAGESLLASREDLGQKRCAEPDEGDGKSNALVLSCPYFRNELGGEGERVLGLTRSTSAPHSSASESPLESALVSHCTNAGVSVLEALREIYSSRENYAVPRDCSKRYIIEHVDTGAHFYHKFFYNREHQNYFGVDENLGPVAVSVRRERLEDNKEVQYNYRVIFRTSELTTLRGSILEDAVPSTAKHGTTRGLPLKDVLEYVVPELSTQCLRLALSSARVSEQLIQLDQQGVSVPYCTLLSMPDRTLLSVLDRTLLSVPDRSLLQLQLNLACKERFSLTVHSV